MKTDREGRAGKAVFTCKCCGHCCHGESTVSMSPDEQKRIAGYLSLSLGDFLDKFCVRKGRRVEMRVVDGHCIFYGDDGLCTIHPVKPFHCRRWPLHPSILNDSAAWEAIRRDCPGFSEQATYEQVCNLIRETNGTQ